MSSGDDKDSNGGRPRDSEATRRCLIEAAGVLFDEVGYERATTREIGDRAGADPALIARYFGGKEGLYLAVLREGPLGSADDQREATPAEQLALLLRRWDERGHSPVSRALASPAPSEEVRSAATAVVAEHLLEPIAARLEEAGVDDPRLRAEILVALALGVAVTRDNGTLEELAAVPLDRVLAVVEPLVAAAGAPAADRS